MDTSKTAIGYYNHSDIALSTVSAVPSQNKLHYEPDLMSFSQMCTYTRLTGINVCARRSKGSPYSTHTLQTLQTGYQQSKELIIQCLPQLLSIYLTFYHPGREDLERTARTQRIPSNLQSITLF